MFSSLHLRPQWRLCCRTYASVAPSQSVGGAIKIDKSLYDNSTVKDPASKKSLLHADYVSYYTDNPTMLILQHNNLTQQQLLKIRSELRSVGAKLRVIRVGIFEHAVRVSSYQAAPSTSPEEAALPPNSRRVSRLVKSPQRRAATAAAGGLDLTQLLTGPVCAITFPPAWSAGGETATTAVSPDTLKRTLAVVDATAGKLLLLGGKFERQVFGIDALQRVGRLPGLDVLRGQVLSLLGAPAVRLSQVLGTPAGALGRTLEGRKVGMEQEQASQDDASKSS